MKKVEESDVAVNNVAIGNGVALVDPVMRPMQRRKNPLRAVIPRRVNDSIPK